MLLVLILGHSTARWTGAKMVIDVTVHLHGYNDDAYGALPVFSAWNCPCVGSETNQYKPISFHCRLSYFCVVWPWFFWVYGRGIPNSGFRLFGWIRIVLQTIRPNKNTNTNSVGGWAFWRCTCYSDIYHLLMSLIITAVPACCLAMTLSPSFVSHSQAVWARAAGTDWVKSAVDVTSCTIHVQTNYLYSFWRHYSSKYVYTIRTTIRHRSEYEASIWYIPSLWSCVMCIFPALVIFCQYHSSSWLSRLCLQWC